MTDTQIVILAAGMGTRLGRPFPKPLTPLASGRTIMAQQMDNIHSAFGARARIAVVVGFQLERIMSAFPDVLFVHNERYESTNTCKSLLKALRLAAPGGVLWMNGDVVFDAGILTRVLPLVESGQSFVCVNTAAVGEEEVKYTVDDDGMILELSKQVREPLGEAVGINFVAPADRDTLVTHLDRCADQDYFERGIETAIVEARLRFQPIDISDLFAVEVDCETDLERANSATV
jgi:choline kinase